MHPIDSHNSKELVLGKQEEGDSTVYTKRMAFKAIRSTGIDTAHLVAADIGAGSGKLGRQLLTIFQSVHFLDVFEPADLLGNASFVYTDLNLSWPLPDASVDFAFSLEVIEHIENPRHFFREATRILRPGGYFFLTTPNNHSVYSKLIFLLKGEHRYFQDASYPAHITPLLRKDLMRMSEENELQVLSWNYSNEDTIPFTSRLLKLPGSAFSRSIGLLMQKPKDIGP